MPVLTEILKNSPKSVVLVSMTVCATIVALADSFNNMTVLVDVVKTLGGTLN